MDSGIGQPVRRKEDMRLLRGAGRFSDDINLPDQTYAAFLRSPHAHARILGIETAAARAAPGVMGVLTAADCVADGLDGITHTAMQIDAIDIKRPGSGIQPIYWNEVIKKVAKKDIDSEIPLQWSMLE